MGLTDWTINTLSNVFTRVFDNINDQQRYNELSTLRAYRKGNQRPQLKVKLGKSNDNVLSNFTGLAIDRSISLLFGRGVDFDLPGEDDTLEKQWIDAVWSANKKQILLHKIAMFGGEDGTCYLKFIEDGMYGIDGELYPRLMAIDPLYVTMETQPEDIEIVLKYTIEYSYQKGNDKVSHRQVIELTSTDENADEQWTTTDYEKSGSSNGAWVKTGEEIFGYPFCPLIHWQNLPNIDSVYGAPDVNQDIILLQDQYNYVTSNINKIIKYHATPKTVVTGASLKEMDVVEMGSDTLTAFGKDGVNVFNLEMQSDLVSSQSFAATLRQSLFDVTRTVDISSVQDKVGQLTNFGLRVLYQDALSKLYTKQALYGDALLEINRRLLVMGGLKSIDPGKISWPETVLPTDKKEDTEAIAADMSMMIVSKQTAATKRGYDWVEEEKRISEQAENEDNVGAAIMRAFRNGQDVA